MNKQPFYNAFTFSHGTDLRGGKLLRAVKAGIRRKLGRRVIMSSVEFEDDRVRGTKHEADVLLTDTEWTQEPEMLAALKDGVGDTAKMVAWQEAEPGNPDDLM